jgi:hypothetical protein
MTVTAGNKDMFGRGLSGRSIGSRELGRGLADFVLALLLFWGVAFAVGSSDMRAHAVPLTALSKQSIDRDFAAASQPRIRTAYGPHKAQAAGRAADLAFLSLAFAALVAGNLAFWRHLRRVYASPRRNVWRRG